MRPYGGLVGANPTTAAAGINSAAGGIWTLRDAERLNRAGTWPIAPAGGLVPNDISGLQLWLDAADPAVLFDATTGGSLVAADGGVARWEDKSGNAWHATQGMSANRPLRKTNAQGGRDGLLFDGANDSMQMSAAWGQFGSNNFTVFAVFRLGATATSENRGIIVSQNNTSNFAPILRIQHNTTNFVVTTRMTSSAAKNTSPDLSVSNSTAYISSTIRSGGTITARVGSSSATSTGNSGDLNLSNPVAQIGRWLDSDGVSQWPFQGHMLEIISYDSALSATDRAAVENYLLAKWGIT